MTTFDEKAPKIIGALMRDFSLEDFQACGIVGNLGRETGGFKFLREIGATGSSGGWGIGQWTGPRAKLFLAWVHAHSLDWRSDEANYGYLKHELEGAYAYVIFHLRCAKTLEQATEIFERYYERAGVPAMADRIAWAKKALAAYHAAHKAA